MSEFLPAFEKMIIAEGGYVLHHVKSDKGGQTYAGIARNRWPDWPGWEAIDANCIPSSDLVRGFYRENFWVPVCGVGINDQKIANSIFEFSVNAGTGTAIKLAQIVAGATPDGKVGRKTLEAINAMDSNHFMAAYTVAKISRYEQIVTRDRGQGKFLLGWIRRALNGAK